MDKSRFEIEILPLYRTLYAMSVTILGDRDNAADAVQEAFAKLWERRSDLDNVASPEAYARTVVKHLCLNRLREASRRRGMDDVVEGVQLDTAAETRSELSLLRRMVGSLPPMQRRVLTLSSFGGCSNDEIAQITGESQSNVRQLLSRARKKLKELYNKQTI